MPDIAVTTTTVTFLLILQALQSSLDTPMSKFP